MGEGENYLFAVVILLLDFFGGLLHDGQFSVTHGLSCDRSLEGRSVGRRVFLEESRESELVRVAAGCAQEVVVRAWETHPVDCCL